MDIYVKNVPSGYYSDESSNDDNDFIYHSDEIEFIYNLKKHRAFVNCYLIHIQFHHYFIHSQRYP